MKIKEIKIINQDGSTELANVGADAVNVDYNDTTVKAELDKLNITDNSIKNTQTSQGNTLTNLQSQISSLASGSPAGVYATVEALTSANPDHSKIYIVTENGHWYYYNGGWQDGGIYQASENSDSITKIENIVYSRITPDKTNFFNIGLNIFNKEDPEITLGGYYNENGELIINSNYNQTGYIPILANHHYVTNYKDGFVLFFDKKRNFLSKIESPTFLSLDYITAPALGTYIKMIYNPSHWDLASLQEGETFTQYTPYSPTLKDELFHISNINEDQTTFFEVGENKFNPNDPDIINGGYYNKTMEYVAAEGYHQTGYIKVIPGEKYTSSYTSAFVLWFDAGKNLLGYTDSFDFHDDGYVVAIAQAQYARFISTEAYWTHFQVKQGENIGSYVPYQKVLKTEFLPYSAKNNTNNLKLTTYGDSIVYRNAWQPFLLNKYDFIHTNLGIGSTTMAYVASVEQEFPCMVNNDRIAEVKNSNPDIIIIMGGTNDCHRNVDIGTDAEFGKSISEKNKANFKGAYSFLIETLLNWKPTLKIILMTPMHSYAEITYSYNNSYDDFAQAVRDIAHYYALNIVDTNNYSGISKFDYSTYTVDGLHPNEAGGKIIANLVNDILEKIYSI